MMYMFNPYPKGFNPTALNIPRLIPLLELLWNGVTFDIIKGKPLINGEEVTLDQAEPYAGAIAHLLEVPISRYQSLKPVIKNRSNGDFPHRQSFTMILINNVALVRVLIKSQPQTKKEFQITLGVTLKKKITQFKSFGENVNSQYLKDGQSSP